MISVFDMFSVGIGPSSSHTVGPMNATAEFVDELKRQQLINRVTHLTTELFGSLGQTGKGHGSGKAVILGLFIAFDRLLSVILMVIQLWSDE